jgi:hypothetical protein
MVMHNSWSWDRPGTMARYPLTPPQVIKIAIAPNKSVPLPQRELSQCDAIGGAL